MKKVNMETLVGKQPPIQEEEQVYHNIINQQDDRPTDEISNRAISELLSKKKLKTVSRIKMEQVSNLTKLYLFSKTFGESFPREVADLILQLQISVNGLSRRELVQLVQQRNMMVELEEQRKPSKEIFR